MAVAWVGSNEGKKWSEYSGKQRGGPWNYLIRLSGGGWCFCKVQVVCLQRRVVCI